MLKYRHQSPAFQLELRAQPRLQAAIAGLAGLGALTAGAAVLSHEVRFWPLLGLVPVLTWLAWRTARVLPRKLQWDGQTWRLEPAASLEPGLPVTIEVVIDFGDWLLLRAQAAEHGWVDRTYLPLSRSDLGASWGLLRATLYSARQPLMP